jgi:hypothetical protein
MPASRYYPTYNIGCICLSAHLLSPRLSTTLTLNPTTPLVYALPRYYSNRIQPTLYPYRLLALYLYNYLIGRADTLFLREAALNSLLRLAPYITRIASLKTTTLLTTSIINLNSLLRPAPYITRIASLKTILQRLVQ